MLKIIVIHMAIVFVKMIGVNIFDKCKILNVNIEELISTMITENIIESLIKNLS